MGTNWGLSQKKVVHEQKDKKCLFISQVDNSSIFVVKTVGGHVKPLVRLPTTLILIIFVRGKADHHY